jgi:gliding motility-associated-like protein
VIQLYVAPPLNLDFNWNPDPVTVSTPTNYSGSTNPSVGPIISWGWFNDQQQISSEQITNLTFDAPGEYVLCLGAEAANGCIDTICKTIPIIPATIIAPNIITPNGDGVNDLLIFKYLEFYPDNHLSIINRWGNVVLDLDNYTNDWNGGLLTEGTYFYKLSVPANEQVLSGFFQIER